MAGVSEGEVPGAEAVEHPEDPQGAPQRMAPFNPDEACDPTASVRLPDPCNRTHPRLSLRFMRPRKSVCKL